MKLKLFIIPIIPLLISCNHGLEPAPETFQEPGFGGKITFTGEWPQGIAETRIVLFKNPLLSAADFSPINFRYISESIPSGTTEYDYSTLSGLGVIVNIEPGEYAYLAVAQSKVPFSLSRKDWTIVGIYTVPPDTTNPAKLVIPPNTFLNNINIECDFDNLPVQPPGE